MNKTNIIVALSAAVVTFFTMAILGAVLLEDEPEREPVSTDIRQQAQQQFMVSCRGENPPEGFCTCAWDELSDMYSVSEMAEMGNTDTYPTEFYDVRDQCLTETKARQI